MNGVRVQGILTKEAGKRFELARKALERLYTDVIGRAPTVVSDSDVIEFLARGDKATRKYLEESGQV
jgi:hypothetical protein